MKKDLLTPRFLLMSPIFPQRCRLALLCVAPLVTSLPLGAADVPAPYQAAALFAVTPRTDLPSEADDPLRPANTRLLRPGVWVDDAGVDDFGNVYFYYRRSSYGTWSNYDETKANPFPIRPALLLNDGQPVADADMWWRQRRPEIVKAFESEVYGRTPDTPAVTWKVVSTTESVEGGIPVITKKLTGHVDNSSCPAISVDVGVSLTIPARASRPVPVIMQFTSEQFSRMLRARAADTAQRQGPPVWTQQVLARGWGYAELDTASIQADSRAGLASGIIGLVNRGQPRKPDDWGVLAAWAWGASRALDYFKTDPAVDATKVALEGHSRWGKAALVATAFDQRFATAYVSCSGEGGAKLFRRNWGETTDNIASSHWMAENFRKYGGNWNALPVDAHELLALVAPRPVFVTGGTQDPWADPRGEFLAAVHAGPVYRLLGKKELGTTEMPAPNVSLIDGDVAFRKHLGPHSDGPDWPVFLDFAARYFEPAAK